MNIIFYAVVRVPVMENHRAGDFLLRFDYVHMEVSRDVAIYC